jgi:hypothetical protein
MYAAEAIREERNCRNEEPAKFSFQSLPTEQHAAVVREAYEEFAHLVQLNSEEWIDSDDSNSAVKQAVMAAAKAMALLPEAQKAQEIDRTAAGARRDSTHTKSVKEALAAAVSHESYRGSLRWSIDCETLRLVRRIKSLPRIVASLDDDTGEQLTTELRYEPLICRLVKHVRWICSADHRTQAQEELSKWILEIFHKMIESGMADLEDGQQRDEQARCDAQADLDSCDVTTLVLELVARANDKELVNKALRLGHALLKRNGGNAQVQQNIVSWCDQGGPVVEAFFSEIRRRIDSLPGTIWNLGPKRWRNDFAIIHFLEELCEGHNFRCQELVREQPNLKIFVNCMAAVVEFLARLLRDPSSGSDDASVQGSVSSGSGFAMYLRKESIEAATIVLSCLVEMVEGPCPANQEFLAVRTELLELLNTVMRLNETHPLQDANGVVSQCSANISNLKLKAVDLILAILEKRSPYTPDTGLGVRDAVDVQVHKRLLGVLHLATFRRNVVIEVDVEDVVEITKKKEKTKKTELNRVTSIHKGAIKVKQQLIIRENEGDIKYGDVATKVLVLFQLLREFAECRVPAHSASFFFERFFSETVIEQHVALAVGSVEIMWDGQLARVFFAVEPMCQRMDEADQRKILESVNRIDGPEAKVRDFIEAHLNALHNQLHYQRSLKNACRRRRPHWFFGMLPVVFSRSTLYFTTSFSFLVVCVINLLNMLCLRRVYEHVETSADGTITTTLLPWHADAGNLTVVSSLYADKYPVSGLVSGDANAEMPDGGMLDWYGNAVACPSYYVNVVAGLGSLQATFAFLSLVVFLIISGPITFLNACDETERLCEEIKVAAKTNLKMQSAHMRRMTHLRVMFLKNLYPCIKMFLLEFHIAYYLIYAVVSVMAIAGSSFLYAVLLFDVLMKNETAHNVLESVTRRKGQLCVTAFITILMIYVFSLFGWLFLPADYDAETCDTLWRCMVKSMNAGLLYGELPNFGRSSKYLNRGFFDLAFFVVVLTVLLNIVFGIIIDTFTELREMKEAKEADKKSVCFICGLDRKHFDDYREHTQVAHNMWHLAFLVIRIWEKSPDDDNGYESYIREKLKARDVSWIPIGRSLELELATAAQAPPTQDLQWIETLIDGANGSGASGGGGSADFGVVSNGLSPLKQSKSSSATLLRQQSSNIEPPQTVNSNNDPGTASLQTMVLDLKNAMEQSNKQLQQEIKRLHEKFDEKQAVAPISPTHPGTRVNRTRSGGAVVQPPAELRFAEV